MTQVLSSPDKLKFRWLIFLFIILTIFRLYSLVEIFLIIMGIQIPEMMDKVGHMPLSMTHLDCFYSIVKVSIKTEYDY
ncbi:hypothetical protein [Oceanispirochaeta sp. M1]|uniref:hypothetical protein n=1 Tax=Oceanispirochaeta sp. M1 TaxID=2283433 RepID=UPI000E09443E|nr:hypothetical protein [Oceanispirochaeta sp. M1]RDG31356.1 hypothetical protein DV872_12960 [Oceanispirochaeta sp. M1]